MPWNWYKHSNTFRKKYKKLLKGIEKNSNRSFGKTDFLTCVSFVKQRVSDDFSFEFVIEFLQSDSNGILWSEFFRRASNCARVHLRGRNFVLW